MRRLSGVIGCKQGNLRFLVVVTALCLVIACQPQVVSPVTKQKIAQPSTALKSTDPTSSPTRSPTAPAVTEAPAITATATATRTVRPTYSPTPFACWQDGGRFEYGSIRDARLPLPMEYAVYLPACYDLQTGRRYPALYMVHGQNYNHDQWDRLGIDETADAMIAAGEISPVILVLPRDRSWAQPTEDAFGAVLVERLIPYIDEHYRTVPERSYRAVGGLSRGAGWAVHLGLSRWELFGAIGAHSLPVFWTDTNHIRGWLDDIPAEQLPRIYLDIGENDRPAILASAVWFAELLNEGAIPHEWYLFPGYHEEAYWISHIDQYLRWYTQEW